ncbi:MAG: hypothetical protein U1E15_09050 [Hyphomicrobiales bacterium]
MTLFQKGAEAILRETDPLSLALVLYGESGEAAPRRAEAIAIANDIVANGGENVPSAENLLGINILDSGTTEEGPLNG